MYGETLKLAYYNFISTSGTVSSQLPTHRLSVHYRNLPVTNNEGGNNTFLYIFIRESRKQTEITDY